MAFLLHFKDDVIQKEHVFYFVLSLTKCVIFSYMNFTFPQTSTCFLSNGIKNMLILASGPDLQAVRFWYDILGEKVLKSDRGF
jgi:hypothetical protein